MAWAAALLSSLGSMGSAMGGIGSALGGTAASAAAPSAAASAAPAAATSAIPTAGAATVAPEAAAGAGQAAGAGAGPTASQTWVEMLKKPETWQDIAKSSNSGPKNMVGPTQAPATSAQIQPQAGPPPRRQDNPYVNAMMQRYLGR